MTYNPDNPQSKRVITTMRNERNEQNQRVVFIGLTILMAVFTVCDILSDIFIRNGGKHPGTDPFSWDLIASLMLVVWIYLAGKLWCRK